MGSSSCLKRREGQEAVNPAVTATGAVTYLQTVCELRVVSRYPPRVSSRRQPSFIADPKRYGLREPSNDFRTTETAEAVGSTWSTDKLTMATVSSKQIRRRSSENVVSRGCQRLRGTSEVALQPVQF